MIVGGQFGSEGKGHVGAQLVTRLTEQCKNVVLVRVGGPNAGHSAFDTEGRKWALRQIPVGAVVNHDCTVVLGAGSEIDPEVLDHEVTELEKAGIPILNRLLVDSSATVITGGHRDSEAELTGRLGSTAKGIGAARSDRVWRSAPVFADVGTLPGYTPQVDYSRCQFVDTPGFLQAADRAGAHVVVEGTQGYGLGYHTEYYPFTTSSDCNTAAFLSMAGLTAVNGLRVWLVFRTHPIRVAGNSGPLCDETSWDYLSTTTNGYIKSERTTVTKKVRRVGFWDSHLATSAIVGNGGVVDFGALGTAQQRNTHIYPCLMFADYVLPEIAGCTNFGDMMASAGPQWDGILGGSSQFVQDIGQPVLYGTGADTVVWNEQMFTR